jgi:hypothetical protein
MSSKIRDVINEEPMSRFQLLSVVVLRGAACSAQGAHRNRYRRHPGQYKRDHGRGRCR